MKIKQDDLIVMIILSVIGFCIAVLAFLLALIMKGPNSSTTPEAIQGSVLVGALSILLVLLWFIGKAIVGHIIAHWAMKKLTAKQKEKRNGKEH